MVALVSHCGRREAIKRYAHKNSKFKNLIARTVNNVIYDKLLSSLHLNYKMNVVITQRLLDLLRLDSASSG